MSKPEKKCFQCGTTETLFYRKYEYWYRTEQGERICRRCYLKTRAKRVMRFMEKRIVFPFKIRIGFCMIKDCGNDKTDRHHFGYISCFPLAMTVELCDMHHREENRKQEELQDQYYFDWSRTINGPILAS